MTSCYNYKKAATCYSRESVIWPIARRGMTIDEDLLHTVNKSNYI